MQRTLRGTQFFPSQHAPIRIIIPAQWIRLWLIGIIYLHNIRPQHITFGAPDDILSTLTISVQKAHLVTHKALDPPRMLQRILFIDKRPIQSRIAVFGLSFKNILKFSFGRKAKYVIPRQFAAKLLTYGGRKHKDRNLNGVHSREPIRALPRGGQVQSAKLSFRNRCFGHPEGMCYSDSPVSRNLRRVLIPHHEFTRWTIHKFHFSIRTKRKFANRPCRHSHFKRRLGFPALRGGVLWILKGYFDRESHINKTCTTYVVRFYSNDIAPACFTK